MALEIKGMKRVFKMKKNSQEIVLDDPNVNMSPAEVMDFYSLRHSDPRAGCSPRAPSP